MNRSSRSVTLLLIASPLFLAGCGNSDDGNRPAGSGSGSGFYSHGYRSGSGGGSFGGSSVGSHASPGGGFGHIGMGAGS